MPRPLEHIRVLDLSRVLAGPWTGQILADLGAHVTKVERPGAGDDTRAWGPPFLKDEAGAQTKEAGYYLAVNRGKRSITVSLDTPEGQEIIRELAAESDILLENFKVGTLARFGLGYEELRKSNPRLIYCSITGFGQDGPRSAAPAYDFLIQAMGGIMSVTGERDDLPGGGPQKVGIPIIDLVTGTYAAVAVLGALAGREVSGQGEYIDVAMLDVQVGLLSNQAMNYLIGGKVPVRRGNAHPNIQPQSLFECKDGAIALVVGNDGQFAKLCKIIGKPEMAADPRFVTNTARVQNEAILSEILNNVFGQGQAADWATQLSDAGVPCGPINTLDKVLADEQVQHRQMLRYLPHPVAGRVPQIVTPFRYKNMPLEFNTAPPLLGQHTDEVLSELGMHDAEVQRLKEKGVV